MWFLETLSKNLVLFVLFLFSHSAWPSISPPSWRILSFLFPIHITCIPVVLSIYIHLCFLHSFVSFVGIPYCMVTTDNIFFWVFITSLKIIVYVNPFTCKFHGVIILNKWKASHWVCVLHFLYLFFCWRTLKLFLDIYWTLVRKAGTIHLLNFSVNKKFSLIEILWCRI